MKKTSHFNNLTIIRSSSFLKKLVWFILVSASTVEFIIFALNNIINYYVYIDYLVNGKDGFWGSFI
ncbi:MAG: hypothetical protein CML47_00145 [Rhodobacteraceae bacterium]|nr:MAG: hypothetical protein CML47_00145 [Paracoccaceae bacterium]